MNKWHWRRQQKASVTKNAEGPSFTIPRALGGCLKLQRDLKETEPGHSGPNGGGICKFQAKMQRKGSALVLS